MTWNSNLSGMSFPIGLMALRSIQYNYKNKNWHGCHRDISLLLFLAHLDHGESKN